MYHHSDSLLEMFTTTFLIENAYFERLSDASILITFPNPKGFAKMNTACKSFLPSLSSFLSHLLPYHCSHHSLSCISNIHLKPFHLSKMCMSCYRGFSPRSNMHSLCSQGRNQTPPKYVSPLLRKMVRVDI